MSNINPNAKVIIIKIEWQKQSNQKSEIGELDKIKQFRDTPQIQATNRLKVKG